MTPLVLQLYTTTKLENRRILRNLTHTCARMHILSLITRDRAARRRMHNLSTLDVTALNV